MRGGYTLVPDEWVAKYGLVGANIKAFIARCETMKRPMTPSISFIMKHFGMSRNKVRRHLRKIEGGVQNGPVQNGPQKVLSKTSTKDSKSHARLSDLDQIFPNRDLAMAERIKDDSPSRP